MTSAPDLIRDEGYKWGFHDEDEALFKANKGLTHELVEAITDPDAGLVQFAVADELGNVVIGVVAPPGLLQAVAYAVGGAHALGGPDPHAAGDVLLGLALLHRLDGKPHR